MVRYQPRAAWIGQVVTLLAPLTIARSKGSRGRVMLTENLSVSRSRQCSLDQGLSLDELRRNLVVLTIAHDERCGSMRSPIVNCMSNEQQGFFLS